MFQISFSGPGIAEIKYSFLCPVPCNFYDDTSIAVNCSVNCLIRHRIIIEVNGEYIPRSDGSIITSDGNSFTRRVPADLRPLRHNYDALGKLYSVFSAACRVSRQHICRVVEHICCLRRRNGLFRHESAAGQRKPSAVDGHLDVVGVCNAAGLAESMARALVQLEAKRKIQRVSGKLARRRIIRPEWVSGLNIYQAKFHSQQYVLIVWIICSQITVIVVWHGARVIHSHVESINDSGNPLSTSHFTRCGTCRDCACDKRQHKHHGEQ